MGLGEVEDEGSPEVNVIEGGAILFALDDRTTATLPIKRHNEEHLQLHHRAHGSRDNCLRTLIDKEDLRGVVTDTRARTKSRDRHQLQKLLLFVVIVGYLKLQTNLWLDR